MGATPAMITLGRARSYAHTIIQCLSDTARRCRCRGRRTSVFFKILGIHFLAISAFSLALGPSMVMALDSLIPGATPSNFRVPAGWQVYSAQTFESGAVGPGEYKFGSITTTKPHSGTRSLTGVYDGHSDQPVWGIESLPATEVYLSYWDFVDSNASFNTEFAVFQWLQRTPFQEMWWTWYYSGTFNDKVQRMSFVTNGPRDQAITPALTPVPTGAWHQYEIWVKANTPGVNNGFAKIYIDGVLNHQVGPGLATGGNLNGSVNMAGSRLSTGGTYTKLIWRRANGSCGTFEGDGTTPPPTICFDFTNCSCPPNPPIFNRYYDDIIVLVPGSGGGGVQDIPSGPPASPFGLFVR